VSPLGAAIDLPHLTPDEALFIAQILKHIAGAIWDAFGDDFPLADWPDDDDDEDDNPPW
jgi:hypothetical protein